MAKQQEEIRILAKRHEKLQTLMCYVNKDTLLAQHYKQKSGKASGVDGVTKEKYGQQVINNIDELLVKMKKFAYKPQPVKRVYIPKLGSDKLRPLGIPAYEDRLVQGAMANVLNEIYETKFLDCSYGFRPNRNCHQAIAQVNKTIQNKSINYILDVDIKGFFDNVNHKWLVEFLEHTIQDKNFIRYIVRFLKSGVMDEMKSYDTEQGTPQGGLISPVLSNVYLHYVLDLWFEKVVKQSVKGEAHLVRYCDDFVIMMEHEHEVHAVYKSLVERLKKFGLEIEEDKTKIIPFGKDKGTKETFDFLGFRHINGKTLKTKRYKVDYTISKKKRAAMHKAIKAWIHTRMHDDMAKIITDLNKKLIGTYAYYGISGMYKQLARLKWYVTVTLYRTLRRRSQKGFKYDKFNLILSRLPIAPPRIYVNIYGI